MQTLRVALLGLLFVTAATASGCLSSVSPKDVASASGKVAGHNNTTMPAVSLYRFSGIVTGVDAPNPQGDGSLAPGAPPAKTDHFSVKDDGLGLAFKTNVAPNQAVGSGGCRIEVYGPDHAMVYSSATFFLVGSPTGPAAGLQMGSGTPFSGLAAKGDYTVRYLVGGVYGITFEVEGKPGGNATTSS